MRSSLSGSSHFCRRIVRHLVIQSTVQSTCWTLTLSSRVFREDMFMEIGHNVLGWSTLITFLRGLMQKIRHCTSMHQEVLACCQIPRILSFKVIRPGPRQY